MVKKVVFRQVNQLMDASKNDFFFQKTSGLRTDLFFKRLKTSILAY